MSGALDSERAPYVVSFSNKPLRPCASRDRSVIEMSSVEPMGRQR